MGLFGKRKVRINAVANAAAEMIVEQTLDSLSNPASEDPEIKNSVGRPDMTSPDVRREVVLLSATGFARAALSTMAVQDFQRLWDLVCLEVADRLKQRASRDGYSDDVTTGPWVRQRVGEYLEAVEQGRTIGLPSLGLEFNKRLGGEDAAVAMWAELMHSEFAKGFMPFCAETAKYELVD